MALACLKGNIEVVRMLLASGHDVVRSLTKVGALTTKERKSLCADHFSDGQNVILPLPSLTVRAWQDGWSALHAAAAGGNAAIVRLLLDAGSEVDAPRRANGVRMNHVEFFIGI